MRILLAVRGPIRPNVDKCIGNISKVAGYIKEHQVDTLYVGWAGEDNEKAISCSFNSYMLLRDPSLDIEYYMSHLGESVNNKTKINSLRMYFQLKMICKYAQQYSHIYDYVVMTRADLDIDISNLNNWFTEGVYYYPERGRHGKQCSKNGVGMNDCFGVGPVSVFCDTWVSKKSDIEFLKYVFSVSVGSECIPVIAREENGVNVQFKITGEQKLCR